MTFYVGKPRILVIRHGAMGDVLDVTAITARLKRDYPKAEIEVETHHPNVFARNPHARGVAHRSGAYSRIIDLNLTQEKWLRNKPSVDCYSLEAFGDEDTPHVLTLSYDPIDQAHNTIAIHPARSWPQRTLPIEFWRALCIEIKERGWGIVALGTEQDWDLDDRYITNLRGRLSLAEQAAAINSCAAFVCSDSGLMAVAHTTKTPIVALLTMTLPYMAERDRFDKRGWGFHPIVAAIPCAGCTHEQTEVNTFFACKFGTNECVTKFNPTTVAWKTIAVARQYQDERNNAA